MDLFWIDPDGKHIPYGKIRADERRTQHTYAGHVWLVTSERGRVLAVFEAQTRAALAIIRDVESEDTRPRRHTGQARPEPAGDRSPNNRWSVSLHGHNLFLRDLAADGKPEEQLTYDATPGSTYARSVEADRAVEMNYGSADPENPTPEVYWAPDAKHFVAVRLQPGAQDALFNRIIP